MDISDFYSCCKCKTPVIVLVVTCFLHGVGGLSETLTTNGRDVTHQLTLSVRANLYGDYYKSLYVHTRGFIALGEQDVRRVDVNRFKKNVLIVPYYNEIYLKKTVQMNTYRDNTRLQDFSKTVHTHFSQGDTFRAKELLVVIWRVFTQFSNDSMQTITLTLGSDGEESYILLNYQRDRSNLYNNFLHFVYGISISGFSAGDEVRFHEIFGNGAPELFTAKLSKLSNIGSPGKWMFKLGGAGGVNKNFAVKSADRKLVGGSVLDHDECTAGISQCHKNAVCTNRNMGYICQCQPKFMGNGKICLKRDSSVYVRGYIDGQVNGNEIYRADHTILVNPKAGDVDVTVIPLSEKVGDVFRVIPMVHGVIPWLFTKSDARTYGKGFDLVGDRMVAKTLINFVNDPSELYITQKIKGIANGALSLITTINGNTPEFGRIKEIHIRNMTELFSENNDGSTSSISISHMEVNDKTYEIKTSRLIVYDPWMKKISGVKHELFMDFYPETFSSYSARSGLYMKFQSRIKNIEADNCLKKGCGTNAECVSTDDGSFICECDDGYLMKDGKCVPKGKKIDCRSNPCGEYSKCVNIPSGFRCDCDSGYKKDSNNKCTNVNECVTERACSNIKNAICVDRPGTYSCVCRPGFKTTDTGCEGPDVSPEGPFDGRTCSDNPCEENAKCIDTQDGGFACQCKQGFTQIAKGKCQDINECSSRPCAHLKNTRCKNTPGYYKCVCKDPAYKMTKGGCILDSCRSSPCKDLANTDCVNTYPGFKCTCKRGYAKDSEGNCVDVNECATPRACADLLNTRCENREGAYACVCNRGYIRKGNTGCVKGEGRVVVVEPRTCRDNPCEDNAKCLDVEGGFKCQCKQGFEKSGPNCVDTNECASGNPCLELVNSRCENRVGSYACICKPGYERNGGRCDAIGSGTGRQTCSEGRPCGAHATCTDIEGGIRCECKDGFSRVQRKCVDVNECKKAGVCDHIPNTECENMLGSYRCKCKQGFQRSGTGCQDVNECLTARTCSHVPNTSCVNKVGSYRCVCNAGFKRTAKGCQAEEQKQRSCRDKPCGDNAKCSDTNDGEGFRCDCNDGYTKEHGKCVATKPSQQTCRDKPCGDNGKCTETNDVKGFRCDCNTGYKMHEGACIDEDECSMSASACKHIPNSVCVNMPGSYGCACKPGYKRTSTSCVLEKDEKRELKCKVKNPCGDNAKCTDTASGPRCDCKRGYGMVDNKCEDLNECLNRRICAHIPNTQCVNRIGSYRCTCNPGYKRTAKGCEVENICVTKPCSENAECVAIGARDFTCKCNPGFKKSGSTCVDVDECERYGVCRPYANSVCQNKPGTFQCICKIGYEKTDSGSCKDIDECTRKKDICNDLDNSQCVNKQGSYSCQCNAGFKLKEGKCQVDTLTCKCGLNQECYTSRGLTFCRCKKGFNNRDGKCEDVDECRTGSYKCPSNSQCVNIPGSYSCQCNIGYTRRGDFCVNFARFSGLWSISFAGQPVDEYTIGKDGRISVKSLDGRMTSQLVPSNDNTESFPYAAGWFTAENVRRPNSIEYIRFSDDGTLEIHHFCVNQNICNRDFGLIRGSYCCKGKGIKDVQDIDECLTNNHKCTGNTKCVNTHGSYKCECKDGYKMKDNVCQDVDECAYDMCGTQAVCHNTIGSFKCTCFKGYHQANGNICTDIDECQLKKDEACGRHAKCINLPGGYKCDCPINYVFAANGKDCQKACTRCLNGGKCVGINQCQCAEGYSGDWCQFKAKDDFLLFAQSGTIKRLSYPYRAKHFGYLHTDYGHNLVGVDYDCKENLAYYSDMTTGVIAKLTYNGLNRKVVLKDLKSPEGLTVDWVGRNIFWVESASKTVNVATLNGYFAKTLFKDNIRKPRAITNNPFLGKIYWSDWDRSNPRIESSNMDGSDRKVFATKVELTTPNGLAINYKTQELCWTDAGKKQIACKPMTGGKTRVLVSKVLKPFSLTFHKEHLFWTDWIEDKIQKYSMKHLKRGTGLQTGVAYDGRLYDIKSVQTCPKACEEVGFDYLKFAEVVSYQNIPTSKECRRKCKEYVGCKFWSWYPASKFCVLKDSDGQRTKKEGVVSGARNCEIAPRNPCGTDKGGCEYLCLMSGPYTKQCVSPDKVGFTFNTKK